MKDNEERFVDARSRPHGQKVDYDFDDHVISGKQKKWKKVIEWIITILGWAIMLVYVLYLAYGMLAVHFGWYLPEFLFFTRGMIFEIKRYFFILFIAALIVTLFLIIWKNYNYLRFGKLHRRTFRPDVSDEELMEFFEVDKMTVDKFHNERYILLPTNIVPEERGIGGKDDKQEKEEKKKRKKQKKQK